MTYRFERFSPKRREVWRPLLIIFAIAFIQQCSGVATVTTYAVTILTQTGSSINEESIERLRCCKEVATSIQKTEIYMKKYSRTLLHTIYLRNLYDFYFICYSTSRPSFSV